jgi:micrococcal nuclease
MPPNVKYAELFVELQKEVWGNNLGLWDIKLPSSEEYYVGNNSSKKFRRSDCQWVKGNISQEQGYI